MFLHTPRSTVESRVPTLSRECLKESVCSMPFRDGSMPNINRRSRNSILVSRAAPCTLRLPSLPIAPCVLDGASRITDGPREKFERTGPRGAHADGPIYWFRRASFSQATCNGGSNGPSHAAIAIEVVSGLAGQGPRRSLSRHEPALRTSPAIGFEISNRVGVLSNHGGSSPERTRRRNQPSGTTRR